MADFNSNLNDFGNLYGASGADKYAQYNYGGMQASQSIRQGQGLIDGAQELADNSAQLGAAYQNEANLVRNQAASFAAAGGAISIKGYKQAGANALAAAKYNSDVLANNLVIELDVFARNITKVAGIQRAQMGSSGLSLSSPSFMAVMNDTLSEAQRQTVIRRNAVRQRQTAILFEGAVQKQAYDIQAQTAYVNALQTMISARRNDSSPPPPGFDGGGGSSTPSGPAYNNSGQYVGYSSKLTGGYA